MMSVNLPLSAAIITKNEENRLPGCLKSIEFVKDIVVVDSGSTDRTVDLATEFGCRVFVEEWKGDGPQKQSAVNKCYNDWVLVLDADERLTRAAEKRIVEIVSADGYHDAYSFPRKCIFHDRWVRHCGWWPDRVVRLFRREKGCYQGITHGRWVSNGSVADLDTALEHYSFNDYADLVTRMNSYSTFRANELNSAGVRTTPCKAVIHGFAMFMQSFVLKRGFLAGFDGFLISLTKAGGSFLKYAKMVEMQRRS